MKENPKLFKQYWLSTNMILLKTVEHCYHFKLIPNIGEDEIDFE